MEYLGLIIGTIVSISMFFIGRAYTNKDKDQKKIEELEQKTLDNFKSELSGMEDRMNEKFTKIESKLDKHVCKTEENFNNTQKEQKELNKKIGEVEKDYSEIKLGVEGNNKLFEQKLNRLEEITEDLKNMLGKITITTPVNTRSKKAV